MERQILHCDMNNFFASVELLEHPELKGMPVAVCGDREKRHGIVLAKNEIAKKYGVATGEPIFKAQEKIPELIILSPHYEKYLAVSKTVRGILGEYTDLVEPFGIDECWMDVSGSKRLFGSGENIANIIRNRIKKETGLTCSVGVSFNKVFAKLGSDMKKPDATSIIASSDFREKIWHLPCSDMLGIGRKTAFDLNLFGIKTIGDVANADKDFLISRYGKCGIYIKNYANGLDDAPVMPINYQFPIKSIGHGVTAAKDIETKSEAWRVIIELIQDVGEKLRFHKMRARGISLQLRNKYLYTKEFQKRLLIPSNCNAVLAKEAFSLFEEKCDLSVPLRSITVRAIDTEDVFSSMQISIFEDDKALRLEKLDEITDSIRKKFGCDSIKPGILITPAIYDETNKTKFSTLPNAH